MAALQMRWMPGAQQPWGGPPGSAATHAPRSPLCTAEPAALQTSPTSADLSAPQHPGKVSRTLGVWHAMYVHHDKSWHCVDGATCALHANPHPGVSMQVMMIISNALLT
jgi:hypothetical protein